MPGTRKQNVGDTARAVTRKALSGGKLDRAALRRITGEVRKSLQHVERLLAQTCASSQAPARMPRRRA